MLFGLPRVFFILIGVGFIWLGVLSVLVARFLIFYRRLTKGITKKDLRVILESLLKEAESSRQQVDKLIAKIEAVEKDGVFHLQRIGLVRFNPFVETGGDQSFSLALLDNNDNGVVLSSLHSRDTTRIYAKPVRKGKEKKYAFSDEEKRAIKEAKQIK